MEGELVVTVEDLVTVQNCPSLVTAVEAGFLTLTIYVLEGGNFILAASKALNSGFSSYIEGTASFLSVSLQ